MKAKTIAILRLLLISAVTALVLAACTDEKRSDSTGDPDTVYEQPGDTAVINDGEWVVEFEQSFTVDLDSGVHSFSYSGEIAPDGE